MKHELNIDSMYEPTVENFKKANRVIKATMWKYIYSSTFEEKEYYGNLVDKQVEFFCDKFGITPERLWLYF